MNFAYYILHALFSYKISLTFLVVLADCEVLNQLCSESLPWTSIGLVEAPYHLTSWQLLNRRHELFHIIDHLLRRDPFHWALCGLLLLLLHWNSC
jgi:hypothetical protein